MGVDGSDAPGEGKVISNWTARPAGPWLRRLGASAHGPRSAGFPTCCFAISKSAGATALEACASSRGVAGGRTASGFGNPRYRKLGSLRYPDRRCGSGSSRPTGSSAGALRLPWGDLRRSPLLSRHRLQSQRLVPARPHGQVTARCGRLLRKKTTRPTKSGGANS